MCSGVTVGPGCVTVGPGLSTKPAVVRGQAAPGQAPMLSDHMDMARPPHENPEYTGSSRPILPANSPAYATIISSNGTPLQWTGPDGPLVPVPETPGVARPVTSVNTVPAPGVSPVSGAPMHAVPIAIPITTFTIASSQHVSLKYFLHLSLKYFLRLP